MIIEIMGEITPETKVKLTLSQWITSTVAMVTILVSVLMYFNVIPVRGSSDTSINIESRDFATKEYVSVNFISKEKLLDTVNLLQTQITGLQIQNKESMDKLDKRQERIENLLLELVRLNK